MISNAIHRATVDCGCGAGHRDGAIGDGFVESSLLPPHTSLRLLFERSPALSEACL